MQIPIDIRKEQLNKYVKLLFQYLERDTQFETRIKRARVRLGLKEKVVKETNNLDIRFISNVKLRSEGLKINNITPDIYIETPNAIILRQEVDKIIDDYIFLEDWRTGLNHFICGDRFLVPVESFINLRVSNKKFSPRGRLSEKHSEQGVKIAITSTISKKELIDWVEKNFSEIRDYLKEFDKSSIYRTRRPNFDRDRLTYYLNIKHKMSYDKIADILADGSTANALQKSCKNLFK